MLDGVLPVPVYKGAHLHLENMANKVEKKISSKIVRNDQLEEMLAILHDIKRRISSSDAVMDLLMKNIKPDGKYIYFCPSVSKKGFNDIDSLGKFLNENRKKIKNYKILNEAYNGTFEELLQDVMKRADLLGNMIGYAFFEMTDKSDKYNKLLRAMGLAAEIQGLVRPFIK
jgi:hypothetical protein